MKNLENFFNSKKGKVVAWLTVLLVVILALLAIWFVKIKPQLNQKTEENPVEVIQQGEEMTGENESDELNSEEISGEDDSTEESENEPEEESEEVSTPYSKISNESYEINKDTNKITFDDDIEINSFVLSDNPDGPTEGDTWHDTNGKKEIELESDEITKKYVYYKAGSGPYTVGSNKYATLLAAYNAITGTSGTITFNANVAEASPDSSAVTIAEGKTITIETNGKTVNRSATITNNGTLKIRGKGTIRSTSATPITNAGNKATLEIGVLNDANNAPYITRVGLAWPKERNMVWNKNASRNS